MTPFLLSHDGVGGMAENLQPTSKSTFTITSVPNGPLSPLRLETSSYYGGAAKEAHSFQQPDTSSGNHCERRGARRPACNSPAATITGSYRSPSSRMLGINASHFSHGVQFLIQRKCIDTTLPHS